MLPQCLFDFQWVDVEPAGDDQVLEPIDDREESILVTTGDVAGGQPTVDQHLVGRLARVQVSGHDLRAADQQLTGFSGWQDPRTVLDVDHSGQGVGQWKPDGAGPSGSVKWTGMGDRTGFGEPVAFHHHRTAVVRELGGHVGGQACTTADAHFESPHDVSAAVA